MMDSLQRRFFFRWFLLFLGLVSGWTWATVSVSSEPALAPSAGPSPMAASSLSETPKAEYSLLASIPDAKASHYSPLIPDLLKKWSVWSAPQQPVTAENPVWLRAIQWKENQTYIGTYRQVILQAPVAQVLSVIEDFESYPKFFEGLKKVRVLERDQNRVVTAWERESPVFFVANVRYEQVYLIDRRSSQLVLIRYQLRKGNSLRNSDGFIVLEAQGNATRLTGMDFYDAEWGVWAGIAAGRIWRESLEGTFKGDLSFKAHLEHPDWKLPQIKEEAEKQLKRFPVEPLKFIDPFSQ